MTIQPIKNDQAVTPMVNSRTTVPGASPLFSRLPQVQSSPSGTDDTAVAKDPLSGATLAPAKDAVTRFAALQKGKETSSLQAQAVRTGKAVEEKMESMQEKMNEIVNSYPPFLRGSEKRQKYLMSISSIRQQIEAMTFPPNKHTNSALDAASGGEAKKIWSNLFKGLDIPALESSGPNEASDAQIQEASAAVGAMRSNLSGRRVLLEQQVTSSTQISPPVAQYISKAAGQGLAVTGLSLTTNLTGAFKGL